MNSRTIGPCRLIHGDSLEILPQLADLAHGLHADNGLVHIVTDPPYESHMHKNKTGGRGLRSDGGKEMAGLDFASIDGIREVAMPHMAAICSGWFLAFCTPEGVAPWRDAIEAAGMRYKRACAWIKPDSAPQFNGQGPAMAVENIVAAWGGKGHSKWNGGGGRNYWIHPCNPPDRHGAHPTEKPLSLMCDLIRLFTNPGDLVIDPFMGSGSTLMAAAMMGRRGIGIEKDRKYFDIAVERLSADMLIARAPPEQLSVDNMQDDLFNV